MTYSFILCLMPLPIFFNLFFCLHIFVLFTELATNNKTTMSKENRWYRFYTIYTILWCTGVASNLMSTSITFVFKCYTWVEIKLIGYRNRSAVNTKLTFHPTTGPTQNRFQHFQHSFNDSTCLIDNIPRETINVAWNTHSTLIIFIN